MVNYLRPFCPHLSQTISPLYDLIKDGHLLVWSETHQASFEAAKRLFTESPCPEYFDHTKPAILQIDASQNGLGITLLQPNDGGL